MQHFSDTLLFLINFAERQFKCSSYIDKPRNTKDILLQVTDPDKELTALQGLEKIILSNDFPKNESFVKLYK